MRSPIETKVALPAIVTGLLGAGGGATYTLLLAYEVIAPNPAQAAALAGFGAFILYAVQTVTAYYAPHTERPDLYDEQGNLVDTRKRIHLRGQPGSRPLEVEDDGGH